MKLLAFPIELQTSILSHASPSDLLSLSLASHHLKDLAFPVLCSTITFHSGIHVAQFFLTPPSLSGTELENHLARRSTEFALIQEIRFDFPSRCEGPPLSPTKTLHPSTTRPPIRPLPRSLRSSPLLTRTLQITTFGPTVFQVLGLVLECLDPIEVRVLSTAGNIDQLLHVEFTRLANKAWTRTSTMELHSVGSDPAARPKKLGVLQRRVDSFGVFVRAGGIRSEQMLLVEDVLRVVGGKGVGKLEFVVEDERTGEMVRRGVEVGKGNGNGKKRV